MTWVVIVWCVLILVWAIVGGASNHCSEETTNLSQNACAAGTGIGVAIILLIGFFGFVFLALIWFMTRPRDAAAVAQQPPVLQAPSGQQVPVAPQAPPG